MTKLLSVLALSAMALLGADVSGKWTGTMKMQRDGQLRDMPALFVLKQEAAAVTGSVGPNADEQIPILKGRLDGSQVSLEVEPPNGHGKVVVEMTLDGEDHMTGEAKFETDNGKVEVKFDLKREK